jgi:nicotinamidase-related amidase
MTAAALILVDGINAFYDPGGPLYYPMIEETVDPILSLLTRAREHGALRIHAVERHRSGLGDYEWRRLPEHTFAGTPDAEIFSAFVPVPDEREVEVAKRRFSAFFATDLALLLREQEVDTVVIAGVKTNVCIRATAQDAFANGFGVVVAREATNSNRPHLAEASLEDIDRYMGRVVSLDEALELL